MCPSTSFGSALSISFSLLPQAKPRKPPISSAAADESAANSSKVVQNMQKHLIAPLPPSSLILFLLHLHVFHVHLILARRHCRRLRRHFTSPAELGFGVDQVASGSRHSLSGLQAGQYLHLLAGPPTCFHIPRHEYARPGLDPDHLPRTR